MNDQPDVLTQAQERAAANRRKPVGAPTPERRLAAAVLERAVRDAAAKQLSGGASERRRRRLREGAREWIDEGGPSFRFWASVAGVRWRPLRREMLRTADRGNQGQIRWR